MKLEMGISAPVFLYFFLINSGVCERDIFNIKHIKNSDITVRYLYYEGKMFECELQPFLTDLYLIAQIDLSI